MGDLQKTSQNICSPFAMVQRALADTEELAKVLRSLRRFCQKNEVQLSVFADGRFSGRQKNNYAQEYLVQSLNALSLKEGFIEIAHYLNGQNNLNANQIAELLQNYFIENKKHPTINLSEAEVHKIDTKLRQQYLLNRLTSGEKVNIDWHLFLSPEVKSVNALISLLKIDWESLRGFTKLAEEEIYKYPAILNGKQLISLILSDVCGLLSMSALEAINQFFISTIDYNVVVENCLNHKVLFASLIAFSKIKRKPSFLLVKNKGAWGCIALLPDLIEKDRYFLQRIKFSCQTGEIDFVDEIDTRMQNFIKSNGFDIKLSIYPEKIIEINKYAVKAQDVLMAITVSGVIKAFAIHSAGKSANNSWFDTLNDSLQSISAYENPLKISVFARTRFREFYAHLIEVKSEITNEKELINSEAAKSFEDMRSNAAKIIIHIISSYQPHPIYDPFGYDFSRRRTRLLNELIDICKDSEIWEIYGMELSELKRGQTNGKLYQDLQLGMFLDKVFEDSKLPNMVIASQINPILLKLAVAGQAEYKRNKEKTIATQANLLATNRRLQLVRKLFDLVNNNFNDKNFIFKIEGCINSWISCNREILHGMHDSAEKAFLHRELAKILQEWLHALSVTNLRFKSFLPIKISLKKIKYEDIGEFIGALCYQKALSEYQGENVVNLSNMVYNRYNELLDQLPKEALSIHTKYVENKRCRIQARRLIRVFEDYRIFHLRRSRSPEAVFDRALVMLHDPLFCEALKEDLQKITIQNEFNNKTWVDSPKKMLKNKDFSKFLANVIKISGIPKSKLHLSSAILKSLGIKKNGK
jgi:hypothetical protein